MFDLRRYWFCNQHYFFFGINMDVVPEPRRSQVKPRVRPPEKVSRKPKSDTDGEITSGVKFVRIMIILLVIAGIGIACYYFFLRDKSEPVDLDDNASEEISMADSEEANPNENSEDDDITVQMETAIAENESDVKSKVFEGNVVINGDNYPIRLTINLVQGEIVSVEYENINYETRVNMEFPPVHDPSESTVVLKCDNPKFEIHLPSETVWGDSPARMGMFEAESKGEKVSYPITF